jgi:hypothetical protein
MPSLRPLLRPPAPPCRPAEERCSARSASRRFVPAHFCHVNAPVLTARGLCCRQLEGQDQLQDQLKKLLLETELSVRDIQVTLHSQPKDGVAVSRGPVMLTLVLDALTVGNLGAEGGAATAAAAAAAAATPEPESASEEDGLQEFQKRVGFEGLRIELARACVSVLATLPADLVWRCESCRGECCAHGSVRAIRLQSDADEFDTTVIARLQAHTLDTPDHLDVSYQKLPQSEVPARRGGQELPSKVLQLKGDFGELRTVVVRAD